MLKSFKIPKDNKSLQSVVYFIILISMFLSLFFALTMNAKANASNLTLKEQELLLQKSKNTLGTIYELPPLELQTQIGQYNSSKIDNGITISQKIPFPGFFTAKKEMLLTKLEHQKLQQKNSILAVQYQLNQLSDTILFLNIKRNITLELLKFYEGFYAKTVVFFKAGEGKKIDIGLVLLKKLEIEQELQQLELLLSDKNLELLQRFSIEKNVMLENATPLSLKNLLQHIELEPFFTLQEPFLSFFHRWKQENQTKKIELVTHFIEQQHYLASYEKKIEVIQKEKQMSEKEQLPLINIGYTNQSIIGTQNINGLEQFFGKGNRFHSLILGLSIPLSFGANQAKINDIDINLELQKVYKTKKKQELITKIMSSFANIQVFRERLKLFHALQSNLEHILQAHETSYRLGNSSFFEYMQQIEMVFNKKSQILKESQEYIALVRELNHGIIPILNTDNPL